MEKRSPANFITVEEEREREAVSERHVDGEDVERERDQRTRVT